MKKNYFLLLAAGCLSCLSVNAQNRLPDPMSPRATHHPIIQRTAGKLARQLQTRAAVAALPDSTVWVNSEGDVPYWKEVYTYTQVGDWAKKEGLKWDSDLSEWVFYEEVAYTYDDNNLPETYTYVNADGYKQKLEIKYEGGKGSYTGTTSFPNNLTTECKAEFTYNDQYQLLFQTNYFTPDVNGDGKLDEEDYNSDGSPWYKEYTYAAEYDASGRCTKETEVVFYDDASPYSEKVTTTEWDGLNYTRKIVTEYPYEERTESSEHKCVVKEGNPQESLFYNKEEETGEWVLGDKAYSYFPKGSETANEAVEAPAEAVKVTAADGKIFIATPENMRVEVYSILGKCCYQAVVGGNASVSGLPAGIYVVRAAGKATKVCVR